MFLCFLPAARCVSSVGSSEQKRNDDFLFTGIIQRQHSSTVQPRDVLAQRMEIAAFGRSILPLPHAKFAGQNIGGDA